MMRIETLKTSADRAGRYWLTLENGTRLGLYRQTLEDFDLFPGKELSQEELDQILTAAGQMSAKMRAVRIVSATNVSKQDLKDRLIRKGEDPDQAQQAVAWMESLNLLDDKRTAEAIVHACISKGYGMARAKQALYEKRIPRECWEEALADYPDQTDVIASFLRTRLNADSDGRERKRAIEALIRKGHSYGEIRQVLSSLSLDTDEEFLEEE